MHCHTGALDAAVHGTDQGDIHPTLDIAACPRLGLLLFCREAAGYYFKHSLRIHFNEPIHRNYKELEVTTFLGSGLHILIIILPLCHMKTLLRWLVPVKEGFSVHETHVPQPPTPMQLENSISDGFANRTIKQKRSKAIDVRFYWVQDHVRQGQFLIYWQPGSTNLVNYHTKHHSPALHRLICTTYLHPTNQLANHDISILLWGCVK